MKFQFTEAEQDFIDDFYGYPPRSVEEAMDMLRDFRDRTASQSKNAMPARHEPEIKAAQKYARENKWPALAGTTKQKWWAIRIRQAFVDGLTAEDEKQQALRIMSAKEWIDLRKLSLQQFRRQIASAIEIEAKEAAKASMLKSESDARVAREQAAKDEWLREIEPQVIAILAPVRHHAIQRPERHNPAGAMLYKVGPYRLYKNMSNKELCVLIDDVEGKGQLVIDKLSELVTRDVMGNLSELNFDEWNKRYGEW